MEPESNYLIKNFSDCEYPVWIEKNLEYLIGKTSIDVAGWSEFRRLIVIEKYLP